MTPPPTVADFSADFAAYLQRNGAEVEPCTSEFELVRFRAHGLLHIVYRNSRGAINAGEFALKCLSHYRRGIPVAMGYASKRQQFSTATRAALLARDGDRCFYCGEVMPAGDQTVEHLVAKKYGGPDHHDNLVLVHDACNAWASDRPLREKLRRHVRGAIEQYNLLGRP